MRPTVRASLLPLSLVVLVALLSLSSAPIPLPSRSEVPAGSLHIAASPVVFLGETPSNGSLHGLLSPVTVIAVAYVDGVPGAVIVRVGFHLDGMNLTSAGVFNNTAFTLPVGFDLRNGPHFANFLLMDSVGTVAYHNWTFTVDSLPPILVVTSPAYPAVPLAAIPVQGTALPALAAAAPVNVTVTALPSHGMDWALANRTTGAFSILIPLSEGPNVLFVNATDAAGNLATQLRTIVSDMVKPPLTVVTPLNMSVSPSNLVRVAGLSEFGAYLTVNGFSVVVAPNDTWSVLLALPDGVNIIQVAAADQVGNLNYAIVVVFVDSDAPRISLASPVPALTNRSSIDIAGTVADTRLVALFVRYNQNLRQVSFNTNSGAFATELTGLPDGTYTIQILAVDAAQRTTTLTAVAVVDTTPPVVRLATPPDGLETNQSSVRLAGSVDDANASVLVDDQVIRPDAGGAWQAIVALVPGTNTIRISAVDAAGNRAPPTLLRVTYFSPYPDLANRASANANNLDALAAYVRLSLVGILLAALAALFAVYSRLNTKLRETRRALSALARVNFERTRPPRP